MYFNIFQHLKTQLLFFILEVGQSQKANTFKVMKSFKNFLNQDIQTMCRQQSLGILLNR